MIVTQEPLFPPGWERQEPDGDERAFVDLHGPQQRRTGAPWARRMGPMWDYGRSAARPDVVCGRRIHTVTVVVGGVL